MDWDTIMECKLILKSENSRFKVLRRYVKLASDLLKLQKGAVLKAQNLAKVFPVSECLFEEEDEDETEDNAKRVSDPMAKMAEATIKLGKWHACWGIVLLNGDTLLE